MITTLNAIRAHSPCADGWKKLLAHLGKTGPDDEPLSITTILDSNGVEDAIWCLRAVTGRDREIRLFAVWCARQVQHLMTDPRSFAVLDVAERFANGEATREEMRAAYSAAYSATAARAAAAAAYAAYAAYAASYAAYAAYDADAADAAAAAAYAAYAADAYTRARDAQAAELRRICAAMEVA